MARPNTRSSRIRAVTGSLWFVPGSFGLGAVLLAVGLSVLEVRADLDLGGLLPGGPAGARSVLSSIITAMISFTALVFSITVVALQLASTQYSPRILRNFLQDRVTQFTLGTFIATFLFAMVVLAALPARADADLPAVSLILAMLLVLASVAAFIYYLFHITTIMQVATIIATIGGQTRKGIDSYHPPGELTAEPPVPGPVVAEIPASHPGIVTDIDLDAISRLAARRHCTISVTATPGDFVVEGGPLLAVHRLSGEEPAELDPDDLVTAISISAERAPGMDVGFGFRQLSDIATRSLSPASNDVTTALRATQEMHDLLRRLAGRPDTPRTVRDSDGVLRAVAPRQTFDNFLTIAVDEVWQAGREQPRIRDYLRTMLADLETSTAPTHLRAVRRRSALVAGDGH
ncbi:DUF2254 domain-containing protein [Solwaraspora sp. WMMD406]|uniref:DUF2254 domain-containing protein n=1 Tax=Solwaraspora sp. WMMD406 TaxID=3016095 RepID=UPI002416CF75|nr:DUF2254 domain-containing protein [Solwaraspora sp. WMMD406]MDG4768280.1 DUF2254 domain-containing protein [Solwaraspora sp. WMMD406]